MKLLFICTHNACRSILSEVITRELAAGRIETASAGSHPGGQVHPLTLTHLAKRGHSTAGLSSKGLDDVRAFAPDVVITVCDSAAKESCPVWFGDVIKVHWGLTDPTHPGDADSDRVEDTFARVIATIRTRTRQLLKQPFERMTREQLTTLFRQIGEQPAPRVAEGAGN